MLAELAEDGQVGAEGVLGDVALLVADVAHVLDGQVLQLEVADDLADYAQRVDDGVDLGTACGLAVVVIHHVVVVGANLLAVLPREDPLGPGAEAPRLVVVHLDGAGSAILGEAGQGVGYPVPPVGGDGQVVLDLHDALGIDLRRSEIGLAGEKELHALAGIGLQLSGAAPGGAVGHQPIHPVVELLLVGYGLGAGHALVWSFGEHLLVGVDAVGVAQEIAEIAQGALAVGLA